MTDVRMHQTLDGGEVIFVNGNPEMTNTPEVAAYLSLWGGNKKDRGIDADIPLQWWGNFDEPQPERHYRSRTQALLQGTPNVAAIRVELKSAAEQDLAWFVTTGIASSVTVAVTVPKRNRVAYDITIIIDNEEYKFRFEKEVGQA